MCATAGRSAGPWYNRVRMAKLSVGVDVIEIARVQRVLARHPERFLRRVYTAGEVKHCRGRVSELAARFAGKEAVMKALGTGVRGIAWREFPVGDFAAGVPPGIGELFRFVSRHAREEPAALIH